MKDGEPSATGILHDDTASRTEKEVAMEVGRYKSRLADPKKSTELELDINSPPVEPSSSQAPIFATYDMLDRSDLGLEMDHESCSYDEGKSSSELSDDEIEVLFPVLHGTHFPISDIGRRADDSSSDSLVGRLIGDMTETEPKEIQNIIEKAVPAEVNSKCSKYQDVLCDVLTKTITRCQGTYPNEDHTIPIQYYEYLEDEINEVKIERGSDLEALNSLRYVALSMISRRPIAADVYHKAWTSFLCDLLRWLINVPICHRDSQVDSMTEAFMRFNGQGNVGFPIKYTNDDCYWLHCKPDCLLEMHQQYRLAKKHDDKGATDIRIIHPVLAIEVKTTHPSRHTSDFVREVHKKASSSHRDKRNGPSERGSFHTDYINSSDTCSTDSSYSVPKCKITKSKPSKSPQMSNYDVGYAAIHQMSSLKAQHRVQLVGLLKWSSLLVQNLLRKVSEAQYTARNINITKRHCAYGLYMVENRVYLTKLSVEDDQEAGYDHHGYRYTYISYLGNLPYQKNQFRVWKRHSLRYKVSDVYLDILDPVHLKALLTYLRVIIYHEQKCSFS